MSRRKSATGPELMVPPNHPARRTESPAIVVSITVRALGTHEHDGRLYAAGETFEMPPDVAGVAAARGAVEILWKNRPDYGHEEIDL